MTLLLLLSACTPGTDVLPSTLAPAGAGEVVLTTTDFQTGALSVLDLSTGTVDEGVAPTSPDPLVTVSDGRVVQLNGYLHDTVRVYDPGAWSEPVSEFALEQAANPHDALIIGDVLWVSLYGRDGIALFDPTTGEDRGHIDLSAFADADGLPEVASMHRVGDVVLVALQRFDRTQDWLPLEGAVAAIDIATHEVTASWTTGTSPRLATHADPDKVWVVTGSYTGSAPALDGTVRALDPLTGLGEPVWDEAERGERVDHWLDTGTGWVALVDRDGTYAARCSDGVRWSDGPETSAWVSDAIVDGTGRVLLASRILTGGGGIAAIDAVTCEDAGYAETALAPYQMARL